ncbi:putative sia-alpha-2,3-Gal-beta-1,4-GlcNAc-R:alpha 2,8-sialyltransferase [Apostichopus japonicus]|uniref:Putative sia-alpha-2,3-Gal-beta-1,4-GlcNAc-R:alpha 2,8-sialyltransferase n=1 Tax=Stichopus japonicus TaxID=307972 RepID=A0A2G8L5Y9_STIJA|nr:putative sia-alpha-2,3-Gal-beta-1,4-GlcNAc-R:alpha 2,8-sialyltransferase [Apostichopus japonicus]
MKAKIAMMKKKHLVCNHTNSSQWQLREVVQKEIWETKLRQFLTLIGSKLTLMNAYHDYRQQYGELQEEHSLMHYRYVAYRQLVRWCWGYLGKNHRVTIPACAVTKIRECFPSAGCNAAPLKPFAADAGNKSNITSFNPSIFEQRYHGISNETHIGKFLKDMKQYHGYLWGACLSFAGFTKVCKKAMDAYNITENTFILGHPDHFKYFNGFWKKRGYKGRLSTGFFYTSDALSRCNEVHLYGFWPFKSIFQKDGPRNINYHYFDNLPFPGTTKKSPHAMNEEFSVLLQLHAFGIIKLHYGKCD